MRAVANGSARKGKGTFWHNFFGGTDGCFVLAFHNLDSVSLPALPFWLSVGSDSPVCPSSPPPLIPPAEVLPLLLLLFVHQPANLLLLRGAASCTDSGLSADMVLKVCENLSCTETGSQSESSPSGTPKTNTLTRWRGVCACQKCTLALGPKQAPILITWDRETDGLFRSETDDYFA